MGHVDQSLADRVIMETAFTVSDATVLALPASMSPRNGYTIELTLPPAAHSNNVFALLYLDGSSALLYHQSYRTASNSNGESVVLDINAGPGGAPGSLSLLYGQFANLAQSVTEIRPMLGGYQSVQVTMGRSSYWSSIVGRYGDGSTEWETAGIYWSVAVTGGHIRVTEHVKR